MQPEFHGRRVLESGRLGDEGFGKSMLSVIVRKYVERVGGVCRVVCASV
jgi:hypothetical protein